MLEMRGLWTIPYYSFLNLINAKLYIYFIYEQNYCKKSKKSTAQFLSLGND